MASGAAASGVAAVRLDLERVAMGGCGHASSAPRRKTVERDRLRCRARGRP
jgi:hypothetical protein